MNTPLLPTLPPMADAPESHQGLAALLAEEARHAAADPLPRWSTGARQPAVIPALVENPTPKSLMPPTDGPAVRPEMPPYPFAPLKPAGDGDAVVRTVAFLNRCLDSRLFRAGAYDVQIEGQACRDALLEELLTRPAPAKPKTA